MATAVAGVAGRAPLPLALWVGRRLGDLAFALLARRRRIALANLARAYPELPLRERRRIARRASQHLGMTLLELPRLLAAPLDATLARITLEGAEHLHAAMTAHGRALMLTAHLGNWEILCAAHRLTEYGLSIVVRPLDAPWLDAFAERARRRTGVEVIDKRGALRPVLEALRHGHMVGILMDQNTARREGVFVDFFGHPASTSRSIAVLAIRTGAPIVPIFARRRADGGHRVLIRPALPMPVSNDAEAAVVELTARCTLEIERAIREAPDQWLWSHDRWRTRPSGEGSG
jgi:Kdo2-lipid IVA lauroyltransferase/acyltransferase